MIQIYQELIWKDSSINLREFDFFLRFLFKIFFSDFTKVEVLQKYISYVFQRYIKYKLWQVGEEIYNLLLLSASKKRLTFQSGNRNLFCNEGRRSYFYDISCTLYGIIFIKIDNVSVTFSHTWFERTYGDRNVWAHEFIYIYIEAYAFLIYAMYTW